MTSREVRTFCRVCEPACGLVATVEDGEIATVRPDRDHPISKGFACNKGIASLDIHRDGDRLNYPMRRTAAGGFERIDWDTAIREISEKVVAIRDAHGATALGTYTGNPTAFNSLVGPAAGAFYSQLGVKRAFSSGTQDCANKFAGSEAVFGSSTMHPIPDIANTDVLLCFGANPRVSHASFLAIADPMKKLKDAVSRGATVYHFNPRRTETVQSGGGTWIGVQPDTDLYAMASLIAAIDDVDGFDRDVVANFGAHVAELRAFVQRYPAERTAEITGIPADTLRRIAREFSEAGAGSVHVSTGVNMGRQGTLAYWLSHMLSFITGNLDRRGGNIQSVGFYKAAKAGRRRFEDSRYNTPFGEVRRGALPGNLMAEYVLDVEDPVRAMFIVAGNPVLSIGGEARLREALDQLELVVCVDLYANATAEYADYLLPSTDMFEREDVNITGLGLQYQPYVQFTERVVEPRFERREEWWIFARLSQALGFKSALDGGDSPDLWGRINHMMQSSRGVSLDDVRNTPDGVVEWELEPGGFFTEHLQTDDKKVDCCPLVFAEALEGAEAIFCEFGAEADDRLKLITKRDAYMHNSWYANVPQMKRGDRDRNYLFLHPDDGAARGIADGDKVRVWNDFGEIALEVSLDPELMCGVVAVTHGWGHGRTPGMDFARSTPGVNPNVLLASGPGSFDPLSNQAHMTGVPVWVSAL